MLHPGKCIYFCNLACFYIRPGRFHDNRLGLLLINFYLISRYETKMSIFLIFHILSTSRLNRGKSFFRQVDSESRRPERFASPSRCLHEWPASRTLQLLQQPCLSTCVHFLHSRSRTNQAGGRRVCSSMRLAAPAPGLSLEKHANPSGMHV